MSGFLLPWAAAFLPPDQLYHPSLDSWPALADAALCGIFAADALLRSRTGYFEGEDLVMEPGRVATHYLRSELLLGVASCVPLDGVLLLALGCGGGAHSGDPCFAWLPLCHLLLLVRMSRLRAFFRCAHVGPLNPKP